MKLSVITPVYCVEETLDRCVESIVGQTHNSLEIILVDDGSPDRCPQMCDEWARRDHRIHVIHKPNGGLSDARNAGIDIATGDYITFVDSDDFIASDTYARLANILDERPEIDLLEYPIFYAYESNAQKIQDFGNHSYTDMTDYLINGKAYKHSYVCNKIFKRKLFENARFPVGRVFEDIAVLPVILKNTKLAVTTSEGLYYYRANTKGITSTATGDELSMLFDSHLRLMQTYAIEQDACYYLHVLNIQMDVYELSGKLPVLPSRHISIFASGLSAKQRIKAAMFNLLGTERLCRINKIFHQIRKRPS